MRLLSLLGRGLGSLALVLVPLLALSGLAHAGYTNRAIRGAMQTETGNQDVRAGDWREEILYVDPKRTRFLGLTMRLETRKVVSTEYKMFRRDHPVRWIRFNNGAGYSSSATSVVVDDASWYRVGDMVLVPRTGEIFRVSAVTLSTNTLTIVRAEQGTTGAAVNDNDWTKILFQRQKEFGLSPDGLSTDVETTLNFAQTFKASYHWSRTRKLEKLRVGSIAEERKLAMQRIKLEIEQMLLWGTMREETDSAGDTYRYSAGINANATVNRVDLLGGLGMGDIGLITSHLFRTGGDQKILFYGRDAMSQWDSLGLDFYRIGPKDNILGLTTKGISSSHGEVMFVPHFGLENAHAGHMIGVDPDHARLAVFEQLHHEADMQENDRHGEKHQFLATVGGYFDTDEAHSIFTGVTNQLV